MEYDNTNRGVLFDNDRKQSDKHPDMTGKLNINGTEHWFSAWWKEGRNGEFLSLSLGAAVDEQQSQQPQQRQQAEQPRRGNRPSNSAPQSRPAPRRSETTKYPPSQGYGDDEIPPF